MLRGNVRALLRHSQIGLADLLKGEPMAHGLAELVTYLSLRDDTFETNCDEGAQDQVTWTDPDGRAKTAPLLRITLLAPRPVPSQVAHCD
jgi:Protein of unknown function (DUF3375)